jgi:hypothetical protein
MTGPLIYSDAAMAVAQKTYMDKGGQNFLMPMTLSPDELPETVASRVVDNYALQLGAVPISQGRPIITPQKWFYDKKN